MLGNRRFTIIVPASSANLGPGFDSVGMALSCYLTLEVEECSEWRFIAASPNLEGIPEGKDNLIYEVAQQVAADRNVTLPPVKVTMTSNIPLARGLGSSASAIVAGIEIANVLGDLQLTKKDKVRIGSVMEGHPDNVGPAVYGGILIGYHHEDETYTVHIKDVEVDTVMVIPPYELKTTYARNVLPEQLAYKRAVEASAVSNTLVAALFTNNWSLVGEVMEKDLFHEPYRSSLVKELAVVRNAAKESGAFGTALSGAGPSILCFVKSNEAEKLVHSLKALVPHCEVRHVKADTEGVRIKHHSVMR
ncbi:homoserine kinase [Priestia koreensis]|uniref:Homoserine kinase n=1 Tax=Priestia koreensis TaxID=284581 RepID=A0A0M0LBS6_9BACI|nr:homoserine kinase [Priestia koreensis]KOO48494.1 serine kinase [Priestia koreensis]